MLLKLNPELQLTEDDKAFLSADQQKEAAKAELARRRSSSPASASAAPAKVSATPSAGLPPAAAAQLKAGHNTVFQNGQVWTIDGAGKPKRVK